MHKGLSFLTILFLASCSSLSVGGRSGVDKTASTEDFDVVVRQTSKATAFRNDRAVDVRFDVTVINRTSQPYNIERIALQSLGGASYYVPLTTRTYGKTVAPGKEYAFTFWTSTYVTEQISTVPLVLRTTIEAVSESDHARREEVFTQSMEGKVVVVASNRRYRFSNDPMNPNPSFSWHYNLDLPAHDMSGAYGLPW